MKADPTFNRESISRDKDELLAVNNVARNLWRELLQVVVTPNLCAGRAIIE